jgi:hypothetical protein
VGELNISQSDTHATPSTGFQKLYPKTDGFWYTKKDNGAEESLLTAHGPTHASGGSDELLHQSLDGAGTNTHAQIDSHIGSTSNPHVVTKTQVGLGNVTDDAQLKRAAGDFATFTEKTPLAMADIILVEDSAAAGAKKQATLTTLATAMLPVFGSNFSQAASDGESTTTLDTYQQKVRLTTPSLSAGVYRIGWHNETRCSSVSADIYYRVQLDDTTDLCEVNNEIGDNTNYLSGAGFAHVTLTAGVHTIDMDYRNETATNTAYIRRARLELWKVSN